MLLGRWHGMLFVLTKEETIAIAIQFQAEAMPNKTLNLLRVGIAMFGGALGGLLTARLVLKVLAARPDNPAVMWLYTVTGPLITPLTVLDRAQPRFGAVLELSTLVTLIILLSLTALVWVWLGRKQSL